MQCRMAYQVYSKAETLYLDNSTAKAYLCNQGGMASLLLSRQAYHILNLAEKHGITLGNTHT